MKTLMHRPRTMPGHRYSVVAALVTAMLLTGCSSFANRGDDLIEQTGVTTTELTDKDAIDYRAGGAGFNTRVYGAIGVGESELEPDTSGAANIDVTDGRDTAAQIAIGVDISNTFSAELHTADLGTADLDPDGGIAYDVNGGSVLLYAGPQRQARKGLMGYARLGVAQIENSPVGGVSIVTSDKPRALAGAGIEYMGRRLGMRGEVIAFNKGAQYAQLGLIYRLGASGADTMAEPPKTAQPTPAPVVIPEPAKLPAPPVVSEEPEPTYTPAPVAQADSDDDGVVDDLDICPNTGSRIEVDAQGCAIFNGTVDGITFARGSANLTNEALDVLDRVIAVLREYPNAMVSIEAHTDNSGNEADNLNLSRERAIAVARYMVVSGNVPKSQLSARAFGEYQPIAENDTADGRALNRRVELIATRSPDDN